MDLTVVIVSYNTKKFLEKCLASVFGREEEIDFEVFVVDNNSRDKSSEMVKKKFPKAKVIQNSKNVGFGSANNQGMKKAKGRYVLLLNSDTEIFQERIFTKMVEWMDKNEKVGISGCALLNPDKTYQGSGGYFPGLMRVFAWMTFIDDIPFLDRLIKPYHPMHPLLGIYSNEAYFKKPHNQDWVTGAFFLIRKKVVEEVGYFDEDFFAYVEEVEYCYRAKKKGWEVMYLPQWKIVHHGQMTSGSEFATTSEFKSLKLFYKKHMAEWKLPILTLFLKLGALIRIIVFGLLKGPKRGRIYAKAFSQV